MNKLPLLIILLAVFSCTGTENTTEKNENTIKKEPHQYGGWYCPDNLNGFPPVDIKEWKNVPVVNGRLPTKEETQTEASLIFIDKEKYPTAKALDVELPQLAAYYTDNTHKHELIIIIQAVEVEGDSIVGFRYLNGGNGSARLNEVKLITEKEVSNLKNGRFVSFDIVINSNDDNVWQILTNQRYIADLQPIFDATSSLSANWTKNSNVNYHYANQLEPTGKFANKLYGCYYVQNDYLIDDYSFVDKFLLLKNEETNETTLKITSGPFIDDYEIQQQVLNSWAEKVKELSEK